MLQASSPHLTACLLSVSFKAFIIKSVIKHHVIQIYDDINYCYASVINNKGAKASFEDGEEHNSHRGAGI